MQWTWNGYTIRPAQASDAENYFAALFDPLEPEVARLTGSTGQYPREVVVPFFLRCVSDPDRHDFLIFDPGSQIIGESVINELNPQERSANYRIAITGAANRGRGVGTWAVRTACAFAFETLHLQRLTLSVLVDNPRALHVYQKCGFEPCGQEDGEILMELTRQMWLNCC